MPAKRLPWYKVWAEHTDHPKVCELSDAEYRTWHYLLAKASQQPDRWRFASLKHAIAVTGRPERHIKALIEVGLLEWDITGPLAVRNAARWQDKYPSDYSANAAANAADTLPSTLPESLNKRERGDRNPNGLLTEEEGDREGDAPAGAPSRKSQVPEKYRVEDEDYEWAATLEPPLLEDDVNRETPKWMDHHAAAGTTALNWRRSWQKWMRNASDIKGGRSPFGSKAPNRGRAGGAGTWATSRKLAS